MSGNARWTHRPPGSTWGDWGPDDELGRLNLLTSAKVLEGIAEVREGRTFCLSLPLDLPGGNALNARRHPPVLRPTIRNGQANINYQLGQDDARLTDVMSDDAGAAAHAIFHAVGWSGPCRPAFRRRWGRRGRAAVLQRLPRGHGRDRTIRRRAAGNPARPVRRPLPGHRAHGGNLRAGPRRDDRPARAFRALEQRHVGFDAPARRSCGRTVWWWSRGTWSACTPASRTMLVEADGYPDPHAPAPDHSCAVLDGRDAAPAGLG